MIGVTLVGTGVTLACWMVSHWRGFMMTLSTRTWFGTFQVCCSVIFVLILALSIKGIGHLDWTLVLFACVATTYFDVQSLKLPSGEDLSTVASVLFFVAVTNGVPAILIVTIIMAAFMMLYHRETMDIILFNTCQYAISATIATLCFRAVGGHVGATLQFSHIIPYLVFNVSYFCCNVVLVGSYLRLKQSKPTRQLITNLFEPQSVLIYFVTLCFGILMTVMFQVQGYVGLISTNLLLAVLAYTFHRYYTLLDHFRNLSNRDELTGLYNHRYFQEKLSELLQTQTPTSLALIDIDYFKAFNDLYGHLQGDALLRDIAKIIGQCVPSNSWTCRYGGEEFGVILPDTSTETAISISETIRKTLSEQPFAGTEHMPNKSITVSIGVSSYPAMATSQHELVHYADEALYRVKYTTRNGVQAYSSCSEKPLKSGVFAERTLYGG